MAGSQQQDTSEEPYTFALQKKKVIIPFPNVLNALSSSYRPDLVEKLKNNIVQTIPNTFNLNKRDYLKRKLTEPEPNKDVKVIPDSNGDKGGEGNEVKYCIPPPISPPITVTANGGELTLVERNKIELHGHKKVFVLTPPQHTVHGSLDQSMSSSSSAKKQRRRKRSSKCSDESMGSSSNEKNTDSSEDSDNEVFKMDACTHNTDRDPTPLQKELSERCYFDNLDSYKQHFEHAYECPRSFGDGSEYCHLKANCRGPETKGYVDREIEEMRATSNFVENENRLNIMSTLFDHSMSCKINSCKVPCCQDFPKEMNEIQKVTGPNGSLSSNSDEVMEVLFSNTSHFDEVDERGMRCKVTERKDFTFVVQKYINKGSFGWVYDVWMTTAKGHARMALKRSGKNFSKKPLDLKLQHFIELQKAPYLLLYDAILSSASGLKYCFMEKAETSLAFYIKNLFEHHKTTCSRLEHVNSPVCNAGMNPQVCCFYLYQMAQGVKYLHDHGYTHGDIKPDNVLIMAGYAEVKLCDFDFVKKVEDKMSSGTPGYVAPEVLDPSFNNVVKPSDVYSLCCCIPEMLLAFPMKYDGPSQSLEIRTSILVEEVLNHDQHLGNILRYGMQTDYTLRPTIDSIVDCFDKNAEMRERKFNMNNMEPPNFENTSQPYRTLPRKVLDYWISDIMNNHLAQCLPPVNPGGDSDCNMDVVDDEETFHEDIEDLVVILEGGRPV